MSDQPRPSASNGSTSNGSLNGTSEDADDVLPSGFRRTELVRLLAQCLSTLGYEKAMAALEQESGIRLLSEPMARFRAALLAGDWATTEALINETGSSVGFTSEASRLEARCTVLRQKYLEMLEAGHAEEALRCLRCELTPAFRERSAAADPPGQPAVPPRSPASLMDTLQGLSSCLIFASVAELKERTGWQGVAGGSREAVLSELSQHIPPSLLLPEGGLEKLLQQALMWKAASCADVVWVQETGRSLLHSAGRRVEVPSKTAAVLERHADEVHLVLLSLAATHTLTVTLTHTLTLTPNPGDDLT